MKKGQNRPVMSSFVPEKYPNIPYNALPILPSFFDFFCFRVAGE